MLGTRPNIWARGPEGWHLKQYNSVDFHSYLGLNLLLKSSRLVSLFLWLDPAPPSTGKNRRSSTLLSVISAALSSLLKTILSLESNLSSLHLTPFIYISKWFFTGQIDQLAKFPLTLMGALAPGSAHARPSGQPPIDVSGNFPAHVSAESPSNVSPNPSEVISEVSEP